MKSRSPGPGFPGVFSVSVKLAPTFAFARIDTDLSAPNNTAIATRSTGVMKLNFSNQTTDGILHFSLVEMGGFFFPTSGASHVTARANPSVAFSWFLNSEGRRAFTDGDVSIRIVGFKGTATHGESAAGVQLFRENRDEGTEGFEFDIQFAKDVPLSTQLTLNNSDFYMITVRCFATHGSTRPPANQDLRAHILGTIFASLPSIDLDVQIEPQIFI